MLPAIQPLILGEILFDSFPDGTRVLGGAPFNVAWHLQALGSRPLVLSGIGDDPPGREIVQAMTEWQMRTDGLVMDSKRPTGAVQITFSGGEPNYNIVDDCAWDLESMPPGISATGTLLYHGSLALRHPPACKLARRLRDVAELLFIDINLRRPWYSCQSVLTMLHGADWLKLNENELAELMPQDRNEDAIHRLQEAYGVKTIVVTRGAQGASLFSTQQQPLHLPVPSGKVTVVDTVGAGDALSAVLIFGIQRGWDNEITLYRAQQFAAGVIGLRGATTKTYYFYQQFLEQWEELF